MELIPGKDYNLVYSPNFCHIVGTNCKRIDFEPGIYTYIGQRETKYGLRNIFTGDIRRNSFNVETVYVMFSATDVDYIKNRRDSVIEAVKKLHIDSSKLKQIEQILNK